MKNVLWFLAVIVTLPVPLVSAVLLIVWYYNSDMAKNMRAQRERDSALMDRLSEDYSKKDSVK